MSRNIRVFVFVLLIGIARGNTDALLAQAVSSASIEGTVADESKATIPGVTVTLTSPALQVTQREAVTDGEGHYRFVDLPIGIYALQYTLAGFQTVRREGVQLTAAFAARVNIDLKIGGVEETITVSGASPIVDVSTT